jgi:hypothetical protein
VEGNIYTGPAILRPIRGWRWDIEARSAAGADIGFAIRFRA